MNKQATCDFNSQIPCDLRRLSFFVIAALFVLRKNGDTKVYTMHEEALYTFCEIVPSQLIILYMFVCLYIHMNPYICENILICLFDNTVKTLWWVGSGGR